MKEDTCFHSSFKHTCLSMLQDTAHIVNVHAHLARIHKRAEGIHKKALHIGTHT